MCIVMKFKILFSINSVVLYLNTRHISFLTVALLTVNQGSLTDYLLQKTKHGMYKKTGQVEKRTQYVSCEICPWIYNFFFPFHFLIKLHINGHLHWVPWTGISIIKYLRQLWSVQFNITRRANMCLILYYNHLLGS